MLPLPLACALLTCPVFAAAQDLDHPLRLGLSTEKGPWLDDDRVSALASEFPDLAGLAAPNLSPPCKLVALGSCQTQRRVAFWKHLPRFRPDYPSKVLPANRARRI